MAPTTSAPDWASYQENVSAFDLAYEGVSFTRAALPLGPSSPSTGGVYVANNRFPDGRDAIRFASSLQHLASDPATGSLFRYAQLSGVSSNQNTFTSLSMPTSLDPAAFDYVPLTITAGQGQPTPSPEVSAGGSRPPSCIPRTIYFW